MLINKIVVFLIAAPTVALISYKVALIMSSFIYKCTEIETMF